jgi:hypothetical protein
MSLRNIIMMSGSRFQFVGQSSVNETNTVVPIPAGSLAGDYCVIIYFPSRTFTGGSGTAWTIINILSSTVKLAHRRLEPGDLTTPLTMSDVTPIITIVYRGVNGISAERTGVSFTGVSTVMTGFTKSANAVALLGIIHGDGDLATLSLTDSTGVDWTSGTIQGPDAWFEGMYYMANASNYTNGSDFAINGAATVANKYGGVFELLV